MKPKIMVDVVCAICHEGYQITKTNYDAKKSKGVKPIHKECYLKHIRHNTKGKVISPIDALDGV